MTRKDFGTRERKSSTGKRSPTGQPPGASRSGIAGTIPNLQSGLSAQYRNTVAELDKIFGMLPFESEERPGDLPTSFVLAEKEIARCISECLQDVSPQRRDIAHIQGLLADYRVLVFLPGKNPSVSLERLHVILQDNFQDSSLCRLMNIFLAGFGDLHTKVVTVF